MGGSPVHGRLASNDLSSSLNVLENECIDKLFVDEGSPLRGPNKAEVISIRREKIHVVQWRCRERQMLETLDSPFCVAKTVFGMS